MKIDIVQKDPAFLEEYSTVSIAFDVEKILDINESQNPEKNAQMRVRNVSKWTKNYDLPEPPVRWRNEWDIANWGIFGAYNENTLVGGTVIALNTDGVNLLEGRDDIAFLWDLRVDKEFRGAGIGKRLFLTAVRFARKNGCRELRVETQNINYNACMFYKSMNMEIYKITKNAYQEFPDEIQIIFTLKI